MPYSDPRALCRELAVSTVQDMSPSMMDAKTLTTVWKLLRVFLKSLLIHLPVFTSYHRSLSRRSENELSFITAGRLQIYGVLRH